jgi:hypothetical protein
VINDIYSSDFFNFPNLKTLYPRFKGFKSEYRLNNSKGRLEHFVPDAVHGTSDLMLDFEGDMMEYSSMYLPHGAMFEVKAYDYLSMSTARYQLPAMIRHQSKLYSDLTHPLFILATPTNTLISPGLIEFAFDEGVEFIHVRIGQTKNGRLTVHSISNLTGFDGDVVSKIINQGFGTFPPVVPINMSPGKIKNVDSAYSPE